MPGPEQETRLSRTTAVAYPPGTGSDLRFEGMATMTLFVSARAPAVTGG